MHVLTAADRLPLTCTREGTCCHGHVIWVNPWEVARMAAGIGMPVREFRERYLDCRGTRLRFAGAPDRRGLAACSLYGAQGCSVHPSRPLTCRMYPLGRARIEGDIRYYHHARGLACRELCPRVEALPHQTVGDYLSAQDVTAGEVAHDAYARVVYGLVAVGARLAAMSGEAGASESLRLFVTERMACTPEQRSALLPDSWCDLVTIPEGLDAADPRTFAEAHGALLTEAASRAGLVAEGAMVEIAVLHVALAMHLAPTVGADLPAMHTILAS